MIFFTNLTVLARKHQWVKGTIVFRKPNSPATTFALSIFLLMTLIKDNLGGFWLLETEGNTRELLVNFRVLSLMFNHGLSYAPVYTGHNHGGSTWLVIQLVWLVFLHRVRRLPRWSDHTNYTTRSSSLKALLQCWNRGLLYCLIPTLFLN